MRGSKSGSVGQRLYSGGAGQWTGANSASFFKSSRGRASTAPFFDGAVLATRGPYVPKRQATPFDIFYSVTTTGPTTLQANLATIGCVTGPLGGTDLTTIYGLIQAESPYVLTGATFPLKPTLFVDWEWVLSISNHGASDVYCEVVPFGKRTITIESVATNLSNFITRYANNFDTRPTGYEFWPQTSLLMNQYNFKEAEVNLAPRRVKIGVGKTMLFKWKSRRTKVIPWTEGEIFTSTGGMIPKKSLRAYFKVCGQLGQVCGVVGGVSTPTQAPVAADIIANSSVMYRYRWQSVNTAPSVYATNGTAASGNLPVGYTVASTAQTFVGIPAAKATRAVNDAILHSYAAPFATWGGIDVGSRVEAITNPVSDCASDLSVPNVHVLP